MINVSFWTFSKRKNSTAVPSGTAVSYSCEIKEPSDLTALQLLLNLGQSEAPAFNYAQIQSFSRYYFITEWRFDRGLWIASLQVDVLASYRTQIGSQSMYVARSASSYNGDVKDMFYPTTDVVSETSMSISEMTADFEDGCVVVGVLGNQTIVQTNPGIVYYQMSMADYQTLQSTLFTTADGDFTGSDFVQGVKNALMNPLQYVISARWYPALFTLSGYAMNHLYAGLWQSGQLSNCRTLPAEIPTAQNVVAIPKHPKASARGSYMNLPPYSRYFFSWGGTSYEIDGNLFAKEEALTWLLFRDYTTTTALLKVVTGNPGSEASREVLSVYVPFGVDLPLGQQKPENALSSIVTGTAGAIASAADGGSGVIAGTLSAISGVNTMLNPTLSSINPSAGLTAARATKYLKGVFYDVVDDDVTEFGRPLMQTKVINTLSGFIRCQNDDISIACLDSEREQIRGYMTGGFFYE